MTDVAVITGKLWHKQEWEDDLTFRVFQRWLLMGDGMDERDLHEAYRLETGLRYTSTGSLVQAPQQLWRSKNGFYTGQVPWEERAKAFEAEQHRKELFWWTKQRDKIRRTEYEMASLLMSKAREMIDWPIYDEEVVEGEDGVTIIRKPSKWALRDVTGLVRTASEVARLAAEMEQKIHKFVFTLSPEAMEAVEILERAGITYADVMTNYERILIEQAIAYGSTARALPEPDSSESGDGTN